MQANLTNAQLQQMQIMQQQQRLATMMQQKQRNFPQTWDNGMSLKQEQLQMQDPSYLQQQQKLLSSQKEINMMRPQAIPQPTMIPSRPSLLSQNLPIQSPMIPQQSPSSMIPQQTVASSLNQPSPSSFNTNIATNQVVVETDTQRQNLEQYKTRDDVYQETLNTQHKRHVELAQSKKKLIETASIERRSRLQQGPASVFGYGYKGYGNGKTGTQSRIRYPAERKKRHGKREPFRL